MYFCKYVFIKITIFKIETIEIGNLTTGVQVFVRSEDGIKSEDS